MMDGVHNSIVNKAAGKVYEAEFRVKEKLREGKDPGGEILIVQAALAWADRLLGRDEPEGPSRRFRASWREARKQINALQVESGQLLTAAARGPA